MDQQIPTGTNDADALLLPPSLAHYINYATAPTLAVLHSMCSHSLRITGCAVDARTGFRPLVGIKPTTSGLTSAGALIIELER